MRSYVEKYAEFKNQTLKKSVGTQTGYLQRMIPGVTPIAKLLKMGGTLHPASNLTYLSHPEQFLMGAKLFPWTSLIKKITFQKKEPVWAM